MLPLIPVVLWGGTALLGGYGAVQALDGWDASDQTKAIYAELDKRLHALKARHERLVLRQQALEQLDKDLVKQVESLEARYTALLQFLGDEVTLVFNEATQRVEVVLGSVPTPKKDGARLALDAGRAAITGATLRQGAMWGIRMTAKASTGTAIRTLTGVAAKRASLSAAGGGAVAAGGGGIAAGVAALNILAIGGTLAYMGSSYKKTKQTQLLEAQKHLEERMKQWHKVELELEIADQTLEAEKRRIDEAYQWATALKRQANAFEDARRAGGLHAHKNDLLFAVEDLIVLASMVRA